MKLTPEEVERWIGEWIEEESPPLLLGVLATYDSNSGLPRSRTVAIREWTTDAVLFFTQSGSRKVQQIRKQPAVSLTILLAARQRQVTFSGRAHPISREENCAYWAGYPKERQLRFCAYGPRSGEEIAHPGVLDDQLARLREQHKNDTHIPCPESYVGYRIVPEEIELYQMNTDRLSDSIRLKRSENHWKRTLVAP